MQSNKGNLSGGRATNGESMRAWDSNKYNILRIHNTARCAGVLVFVSFEMKNLLSDYGTLALHFIRSVSIMLILADLSVELYNILYIESVSDLRVTVSRQERAGEKEMNVVRLCRLHCREFTNVLCQWQNGIFYYFF